MFEFYVERSVPILDGIGLVWVGTCRWVVWVVLDCFLGEKWLVWVFWGGIMLVLGW